MNAGQSADPGRELRKGGAVVGIVDPVVPVASDHLTFAEVLVKGDLSGALDYRGHHVEIESVDSFIGLERGPYGLRGPVWKGVVCKVAA